MFKTTKRSLLIPSLAACLALLPLNAPAVLAQLDEGGIALFQDDQLAGVVWIPERPPEACEYKELWYLFSSYEYPGLDHPITTILEVAPEYSFEDEDSFRFAMEDEFPDGHFVLTVSIEEREDCQ